MQDVTIWWGDPVLRQGLDGKPEHRPLGGSGNTQEDGRDEGSFSEGRGQSGKASSLRDPLSWTWKEEWDLHAEMSRAENIPETGKGMREGQRWESEGLRVGRRWIF